MSIPIAGWRVKESWATSNRSGRSKQLRGRAMATLLPQGPSLRQSSPEWRRSTRLSPASFSKAADHPSPPVAFSRIEAASFINANLRFIRSFDLHVVRKFTDLTYKLTVVGYKMFKYAPNGETSVTACAPNPERFTAVEASYSTGDHKTTAMWKTIAESGSRFLV